MDTETIAMKVVDDILKVEKPSVSSVVGSDSPIRFKKSFSFGKRRCIDMNYNLNVTDDSGYIPFEKEIERFTSSGDAYQQYMRMAFPNGSADKVAHDYEASLPRMSRLDAINYINDRSFELQSRLYARASDACAKKPTAVVNPVGDNRLGSGGIGGNPPDNE